MEYKKGDILYQDIAPLLVMDVKKGGFGIVYIVYDQQRDTICALKSFQHRFFKVADRKADEVMRNFYREAEVWVKLGSHENIIEAFGVTVLDYRPLIIMEYADGENLRERLLRSRLSIPEALSFAIQFCDGMIYANSVDLGGGVRGIVHRDIKPSNIMLTKEGVVKVTDFGLVKALGVPTAESPFGTPEYMSPEQFETMNVDVRSDIYSFGVVLYEMLSGKPPFYARIRDDGERWMFYECHHQEVSPKPLRQINPLIPEKLDLVVMKCLEKRPYDRYQSFETLKEELMEIYRSQFGQVPEAKIRRYPPEVELLRKGIALISLGKPDEAISFLDRVLEINPMDADATVHRGLAMIRLGKYDEALRCFDWALEINASHELAWASKADALIRMGRHMEALECCDRALKINPRDSEAWRNKGYVLHFLGRYGEAISFFDRALEIEPRDVEAWVDKGMALFGLGRHKEAIECFDKALEIHPRYTLAWYSKGSVLTSLNRFEEAIECLDRALEINPRHELAWVYKGSALAMLERDTEAIECYDRSLEIEPRNAEAWYNKAVCLNRLGRRDEALKCIRKAIEIEPSLWKTLGGS